MTAAWASVLIAALIASGTALAFVARMSARSGRLDERVRGISDQLSDLVGSLRADRTETNARLTWLERQIVWRLGSRDRDQDQGRG